MTWPFETRCRKPQISNPEATCQRSKSIVIYITRRALVASINLAERTRQKQNRPKLRCNVHS